MPLRELNLSDFLGVTNIELLGLCEHLSLMWRPNQFGKGQPNKWLASSKKHILIVNRTSSANMLCEGSCLLGRIE